MKGLTLLAFIIFFAHPTFSQENGTLSLSAETLKKYSYSYELDQFRLEHYNVERFSNFNWKYHPGDDIGWKETSFNDSNWAILRTDFSLGSIPKEMWTGIGWFRLKLIIDPSLHNQAIAAVITHYGASEMYLDGKLVNQFGTPSNDPSVEKTMRPQFALPAPLALDDKPEHILAIRYSFVGANKLYNKYGILWNMNDQNSSAGFLLHFGSVKEAIKLYGNSLTRNLLCGIITLTALLIIGSFHFFLYRFYSRDRFSLYIAIFNFVLAGHSFTKFLPTYAGLGLEGMVLDNFFNILAGCFWIPALMLAYYSVFYSKLPKHVWLYFIISPVMGYLWMFQHPLGDKVVFWFSLISFFICLDYLSNHSLKKKNMCGLLVSEFY